MNDKSIEVIALMNGSRGGHGFGEDRNRIVSGGGWHRLCGQRITRNRFGSGYMCRKYEPFRERHEWELLLLGRDKSNSDM